MGDNEDHVCIHESKIILLVDHVADIGKDTKSLIESIKGNGKPGIMTRMALQDQCLKKLHGRLDDYHADLKEIKGRADQCVANDASIRRLWQVITWVGGPTTLVLWAAMIKYMFFGG